MVRSGIDAGVTNSNVAEYRGLPNRHLTCITAEQVDGDVLLVQAETTTSKIRIATAARTTVTGDHARRSSLLEPRTGYHAHEFTIRLSSGMPVVLDKTVAIVTSKDPAIASPAQAALNELNRAPAEFGGLLAEHTAAWSRLWEECRIDLDAPTSQDQLVLNLHVFHLLQTVSPHTAALDAGVTARGLHGEGYRGHVFWAELFVMPLLTLHLPGVARSLLEYRWRRLPGPVTPPPRPA